MSGADAITVEASGETVGEAKWAALRELEQLVPGLDRESVEFQVVSEGERGLLGVGFTPAQVIASASAQEQATAGESSEEAETAREFVQRVAAAIGASVKASVSERDDSVTVTVTGTDLGLFIGKQVGVFCFAALAVRLRLARLPVGANWRQLYGVACLCGIGFTMSLFIACLAFSSQATLDAAKLAVLVASAASALIGALILLKRPPVERPA